MIALWVGVRQKVNDSIDNFFIGLSKSVADFFTSAGAITIFFFESSKLILKKPYRFEEIIKHIEFIGNKSILIILLTGAFTGMAMSFQIFLGFNMVNATNLVGPTVALGITRELGPVLTGLIVAARAGGAMAARLGTMRVNEQIDALEVMGIDPKQYLVAPRIIAAFVSMPLLCGVFDFIAMGGSYFLCVKVLGLDDAIFWDKISAWLNPRDINEGLIKSAIFGLTFTAICTYRGFYTTGGAKGVGEATNGGVVNSMVLIIVINFFATNIIRFYYSIMGIGQS
jgi:phospholipid/cholesterol/gamma-HCH transport system permease protein